MKLSLAFKQFLKKPLGNLLSERDAISLARESKLVVSVGDVTTLLFFSNGLQPNLAIIDLRVQRRPLHARGVQALRKAKAKKLYCSNARGTISQDALNKIALAYNHCTRGKRVILFVDGEEDLLFLPAVLHAPDNALLLYGQPGEGVVAVRATEKTRKEFYKLVEKCFY